MSGDSLVLKVVESDETGHEINRVYVFYDHNIHAFGIRGGFTTPKGYSHRYSYYVDNVSSVMDLIIVIFNSYYDLSVCLVNYEALPTDPDSITFDSLFKDDNRLHEIAGHDFGKSVMDQTCTKKKNKKHRGFDMYTNRQVARNIESILNTLVNVYNYY
jgi:hypothetical protein